MLLVYLGLSDTSGGNDAGVTSKNSCSIFAVGLSDNAFFMLILLPVVPALVIPPYQVLALDELQWQFHLI